MNENSNINSENNSQEAETNSLNNTARVLFNQFRVNNQWEYLPKWILLAISEPIDSKEQKISKQEFSEYSSDQIKSIENDVKGLSSDQSNAQKYMTIHLKKKCKDNNDCWQAEYNKWKTDGEAKYNNLLREHNKLKNLQLENELFRQDNEK
ncbi:hypothetical protein Glove_463g9 [Diversispora epigaea]|uniref:Uncharacterized protein n=1 Tax=Diversispora epigaea TaxID=1348612 RepID=A0A397GMJ6_9GLOM|nr:hypothetical protein Glove_463g9 [Diversispora epigaea]